MEQPLKERLFGALIIIALFVIFLPMVFKEPYETADKLQQKPQPDIQVKMAQLAPPPELTHWEQAALEAGQDFTVIAEADEPSQMMAHDPIAAFASADDDMVASEAPVLAKTEPVVEPIRVVAEVKPALAPVSKLRPPAQVAQKPPALPAQPALTQAKIKSDKAWAVQLATFANKNNANALVTQLKKEGYQAFLQGVHGQEKTLTWVMVGPKNDQQSAKVLQKNLMADYKLKGLIVPVDKT